jgi:hypothetical protein
LRRGEVLGLVVLVAVVVLAVWSLSGSTQGGAGSALSRSGAGWLAARAYLEAQGTDVQLLDRPLADYHDGGVLVLAFPWQRYDGSRLADALARHLRAGGDVVFAFAGQEALRAEAIEAGVAEGLGLGWHTASERPPLNPLRWREYAGQEWDLVPEPSLGAAGTLRVRALRAWPEMPEGGQALFRDPAGRPVVFTYASSGGRVVALPAEVLCNARLAGSADLLETLRVHLGDRWTFDEIHHGLFAAASPGAQVPRRMLDLWLLHLAVLYGLCLWALGRRLGPAWSEPPLAKGSAAAFLLGLGALHQRLGHHGQAAALLVARARELDPRLASTEDQRGPAVQAGDARGLVELAGAVAVRQRPRAEGSREARGRDS